MKQMVVQTIELSDEELSVLTKANKIIEGLLKEVITVPSHMIDDQILPKSVDELIRAALLLENVKVYSCFNRLSDENRIELMKEIRDGE